MFEALSFINLDDERGAQAVAYCRIGAAGVPDLAGGRVAEDLWLTVTYQGGMRVPRVASGGPWHLGFIANGFLLLDHQKKGRRLHRTSRALIIRHGTWNELDYIAVDDDRVDSEPILRLGFDGAEAVFAVKPLPWDLRLTLRYAFSGRPEVDRKFLRRGEPRAAFAT